MASAPYWSPDLRAYVDELTKCPICLEDFLDPKGLPCFHTFCRACIAEHCVAKLPGSCCECPICRTKFVIPENGIDKLPNNFAIKGLTDVKNIAKTASATDDRCDVCSDDDVSVTSFCTRCHQKFCDRCTVGMHCTSSPNEAHELVAYRPDVLVEVVKQHSIFFNQQLAYEKELTQLQKQIADTAALINDNKLKVMETSFDERLAELQRRMDDAKTDYELRLHDAYTKLEQSETKASDWEAVAEKLNEQLIDVERQRDHFENESDRWRFGAENLEREKTEVEQQRDEIEALASNFKIEIDELKQTHEDLEKQNAQLGDFIASITTERDQLRVSYDAEVAAQARGMECQGQGKVRTEDTRNYVKFIGSLSEGNYIRGLTTLYEQLYVLYDKCPFISVYDTHTYDVQHRLTVPHLGSAWDMASCQRCGCIYIGDYANNVVHRAEVSRDKFTRWPVDDEPAGLSVNAEYQLVVTCWKVNKIKIFTTYGELVKVIDLIVQPEIVHPWHAIQLLTDRYIVCHGGTIRGVTDPLHRVCIVDGAGRLQRSFGGVWGSGENQLFRPERLAVVSGFIFVVDTNNSRVLTLTSTLRYVRAAMSELGGRPTKIWFDKDAGRLYLGENNWQENRWTSGRVSVYSVVGNEFYSAGGRHASV